MNIYVVRKDTLEELEQMVTLMKAEGWSVKGEGVPFWENGQHGLEMERTNNAVAESFGPYWMTGSSGEEHPSLNELSDLSDS
jgi:hypothetical protein